MIRAILHLAQWLDHRFPPKVAVTQEVFDSLTDRLHQHGKTLAALQNELSEAKASIASLDKSVAAIKDLLAKSGNAAIVAERRRADFIASGRMAE